MSLARPDVVFNAAAYTAVDAAENDRARAFAVNETGVRNVARSAASLGARLIHVSTDFVFDGAKRTPYKPEDPTSPLGAYGESKRAGERAVQQVYAQGSAIIRTSWLYSAYGKNFVKTILRLLNERSQVGVVADQCGSPTYARGLAQVIWRTAADARIHGIFHWSDAGAVSWYEFAVAIKELGLARGLVRRGTPVVPITTAEYQTAARRPAFSVLDSSDLASRVGMQAIDWRINLGLMLDELRALAAA